MPWDFEEYPEPPPFKPTAMSADEAALICLQLASIYLTPEPDASFTLNELQAEAERIDGLKIPTAAIDHFMPWLQPVDEIHYRLK